MDIGRARRLVMMHAAYWIFIHPVNEFWTRDLNLTGASAGFFAIGKDKHAAREVASDNRWVSLRNRWEYSHVVRAVLWCWALVSLIVAVAVRGSN